MYEVEKTFEDVLAKHQHLLTKLTHKLLAKPHYRACEVSDIKAIVQYAAWQAWLAQRGKVDANGQTKYTFGTYITFHIQKAAFLYNDVGIDFRNKNRWEYLAGSIEPHDIDTDIKDFLDYHLKQLPIRKRKILENLYFNDMTLQQCGEQFGVSRERIRQIESEALENIYARAA